jgi:hypothetical protein
MARAGRDLQECDGLGSSCSSSSSSSWKCCVCDSKGGGDKLGSSSSGDGVCGAIESAPTCLVCGVFP